MNNEAYTLYGELYTKLFSLKRNVKFNKRKKKIHIL